MKLHFVRVVLPLVAFCAFAVDTPDEDFPFVFTDDEGITIMASAQTTQQIRTVTKEDIEHIHAPDVTTLLETALGLDAVSYGPYGNVASVSLRGLGAGRVAVLVDGVPVNSPQSGSADLTMLDVNNIEKIEVVYGGSDTKFNVSGALGGVINIITVKKQKPGVRFGAGVANTAVSGTTLDSQNINFFASSGHKMFSWSANLFTNHADNYFLYTDDYGIEHRRENNQVRDTGAGASFAWNFDDLTRLALTGDFYYGDKNIPGPMTAKNYGNQKDFSTRQTVFLEKPVIFRDDLAMEASVSHSWQTLEYKETPDVSLHKIQTVQAINRWYWYPLDILALTTGWDYRYSRLDSTNIGLKSGHDGGISVTAEYGDKVFLVIPSVKLVLSGIEESIVAVPVPKLGFVWNVFDSLTLKNNYFRSFKLPTFNDRYWSGDATARGNPDLRPEDGWGTDLGVEYRYGKLLAIDGTVYASWIRDSIQWRSVNSVWRPENIGEAALFGFDSHIQSEIPLSAGPVTALVPSLSYQYLLSYILTEKLTFDSGIRMPYMPMHRAALSLDVRWNTGSALFAGQYEGLRYTETLNIVTLEPYWMLNATVNQNIGDHFTTFAVFRNILNVSYVSMLDYPMPGFSLTLGMRFTGEI
jgi:vitamin B12 transporter